MSLRRLAATAALLLLILNANAQNIMETTPLPEPRHFHGTAVMGDFLYVFGGADGKNQVTKSVMKAPLAPDGRVGPWSPATELPNPRLYIANSTLVLNDVVYIIGGASEILGNNTAYGDALWSKPLPNGQLTPWQRTERFGDGFDATAAVSTPGHIHVIGGEDSHDVVHSKVITNQLYSDGSFGKWEAGPELPYPVWFHHAGVAAGRVYVWGGRSDASLKPEDVKPLPYVLSSPILGTGKLGAWRRESNDLPGGMYSGAATVAGYYLMTFAPRYAGGQVNNDIWWTYATPNGLVPWQRRPNSLPVRVYHCVAPDYRRGCIYIPAGRPTKTPIKASERVFYMRLSGQARNIAERTWAEREAAHSFTVSAFPPPDAGGGLTAGRDDAKKLSYIADTRLSSQALAGFQTPTAARENAQKNKKPMVIYFNLAQAEPCRQQIAQLKTEEFSQLLPYAEFAWIDTQEYPQLTQQLGVYRVPTWVFYDAQGAEVARHTKVMSYKDIAGQLLSAAGTQPR
ncbi:MAG: hypothetical protein PWP23_2585 [Candidatus Sumerlaeota bacterium]|nr:hypothetical protein [Candidatus Sumerlaeota bacterium]